MKAAVGLGNPGLEYALTRHNVGFHVVDLYRRDMRRVGRGRRVHQAVVYRQRNFLLMKPSTFMNASGDAVAELVAARRLRPEDVLIVHDDLDLPLGRLRIVPGGGAGTHKGVQSVIEALGTTDFPRLKVGIEIADRAVEGSAFVLEPFPEAEWAQLVPVLHRAAAALAAFARLPLDHVMTQFNTPPDEVAAA